MLNTGLLHRHVILIKALGHTFVQFFDSVRCLVYCSNSDCPALCRYGPKSSATEYSPLIEKLLADSK